LTIEAQDLDERLAEAVKVRDQLKAEIQRIEGRREAALKTLNEVEEEIRDRNLDPDTLDATLAKLREAYEKAVLKFEVEVQQTQEALSPYLEIK